MEDITPLNLEDHPKLFGLRYDQLIVVLISLIGGSQLYSWMNPVQIGPLDLRMDLSILIALVGPVYCLVTIHNTGGAWENVLNFFFSGQVFIPGPDPNPTRFLLDEELVDICE